MKIRVVQEFETDDLQTPMPGELAELEFDVSAGSDAERKRVSVDAVVESVPYSASGSRSERVISLVGLSSDGAVDPVRVDDLF